MTTRSSAGFAGATDSRAEVRRGAQPPSERPRSLSEKSCRTEKVGWPPHKRPFRRPLFQASPAEIAPKWDPWVAECGHLAFLRHAPSPGAPHGGSSEPASEPPATSGRSVGSAEAMMRRTSGAIARAAVLPSWPATGPMGG